MEETGCYKEEAKEYLENASGNITLALKNILRDIKPIGVIKCRFTVTDVNIYGLMLVIFNGRNRKILRFAAVAGCNPEIYETDNRQQWFSFEKNLYSQRLKSGSLRELTQNIEQSLLIRIQEQETEYFYRCWDENDIEKIKIMVTQQIKNVIKYDTGIDYDVAVETECQSLNLRQFKYLTDVEKIDEEFKLHLDDEKTYSSLIVLDAELVRNSKNVPCVKVENLEAGDVVYTNIVDTRDIGIYLSHLLGARYGDDLVPHSATIEDVKDTEDGIEVMVRFGPGIVGRALENAKKRVGIIKEPIITRTYKWIYIFIAFAAIIGYYIFFMK